MDGMTATRLWIAEVNGRSVGFVQDYKIKDYPEYALLAPDPEAIGVDYAIGEEVWLGRGLGTRILWAWMLRARSRFPGATAYFAAPDHRNETSLRLLDKLGFTRGLWFDEPQADGTVSTVVGCTLDATALFGPGASVTR
jgi:RimJ/RimL family protein N-acetyltransferase